MNKRRVTLYSILAALLAANYVLANYPEQSLKVAQASVDFYNSATDNLALIADTNADGCVTTIFGTVGCVSAGGYLKSIISEMPLSQEESANLPAFQGEQFPAPAFLYRV